MTECPSCGGVIYDNRQKVEGGWKGPLFKCKDQDCGWKKWAPKGQQAKGGTGKGGGFSAGPKWTWPQLSQMYANSVAIATKHIKAAIPTANPEEIVAGAATVFIAATRDGIKPPAPKPEPKPEPQPVVEDGGGFNGDDEPFPY